LEVGSQKRQVKFMSFKFEKIVVWQRSMEFGEMIFNLSKKFPGDEKFNLISQICRAVDSVALNISEGSILQSKLEFKRFLAYSIRSLAEVVTCLYKAKNRNYISEEEFNFHYKFAFDLMNSIIAFRNNLK
jgi:four helix bundle protein